MINSQQRISKYAVEVCKCFVLGTEMTPKHTSVLWDIEVRQIESYFSNHKLVLLANSVLSNVKEKETGDWIHLIARRARKIAFRDLTLYSESNKIEHAFAQQKIPILAYKGQVFGRTFYQAKAIRNSVDVDFAIRIKDLPACRQLMLALGYEEAKEELDIDNLHSSRAFYIDYPWKKKLKNGTQVLIEFHLAPAHKALYIPISFEQYLTREVIDNEGASLKFTKVQHALFVIIHHGAVDLWGKLLHLVDLHQIIHELQKEEVTELIQLCETARIRKFFDLGVQLNEFLFDNTLNVPIKYPISTSQLSQIADDIIHSRLAGKWSENRQKLRYHLAYRDSFIDQIRTIKSLLRYSFYKKFGR